MLTIEVELLHGTFRASTQDTALTGLEDTGEWPPSPARLFSALVAADGTGERCRVTDGSELRFLETQPPPTIHADSRSDVVSSPVRERFVVIDATKSGAVQNYPARQSNVARPGTRISPRHPQVRYVWAEAEPGADTLRALRLRAARIGYLGCADSPVRVKVHEQAPEGGPPPEAWEPAATGTVGEVLPVPFPGLVDVLDEAYEQFCEGVRVRRAWLRDAPQLYRSPKSDRETYRTAVHVVWLQFDRLVPARRVLAVTSTLRAAVFEKYQQHVAGKGNALPPVLTGHGFTGRGFHHAHWLALPNVNHKHSDGRLHGAAIWLPEETPEEVVAGVRTATWHLRELVKPGVFRVGVRPHDGSSKPWSGNPHRWTGESRHFASVFPVVHERFVRPRPRPEDVATWCRHAGLPEPTNVKLSRDPVLAGAPSLHPREVFRPGDERRPYSHMELTFDRPVAGPVVLGRKRHLGLGLFAPLQTSKSRGREERQADKGREENDG